jgi:hypothetical protein
MQIEVPTKKRAEKNNENKEIKQMETKEVNGEQ